MFDKLRDTVENVSENVKSKVAEKEITEEDIEPVLEEFKLQLMKNNVSIEVAEQLIEKIKERLIGEKAGRLSIKEEVKEALNDQITESINDNFDLNDKLDKIEKPQKIFLVGFNGSGKTTTAAKLSNHLEKQGHKTVLGAGDTFRAASIEQLEEHGENLGVKVISHEYEADPAAVGYDTVEHAQKEDKIAIVDTAGRSHADQNLMDELEKMVDVNQPDITFLVVDALSGNDVLNQVEAYKGMFDAIIITKTDIDDKGGVILSISEKTDKPIAYKGTGQEYSDLEEFNKEDYVKSLTNF